MYITSIYLENVTGIYAGMDLDKISIDIFDERENICEKINLICGQNGSGKSTLFKSLNPFATEVIRENEKGKKIIVYMKKKWIIEITHIFTPKSNGSHTVKSFIVKKSKIDGEEIDLNPNGNVSTFLTAVEEELDITPSKLKLMQLGNDMSNLLKMTPTERKKYISEFTSDADIYLEKYKKVSSDFITVKKMLENIGYNLNRIGNIESLKDKLKSSEKDIADYNNELMNTIVEKSNYEKELGEYSVYEKYKESYDKYNELIPIKVRLSSMYGSVQGVDINASDTELINKINTLQNHISDLNLSKTNSQNLIDTFEKNIMDYNLDILSIENKLENIQYKDMGNLKELIKSHLSDINNMDASLRGINPELFKLDESLLEMIKKEGEKFNKELEVALSEISSDTLSMFGDIDYKTEMRKLDSRKSDLNAKLYNLTETNKRLNKEKNDMVNMNFTFTDICKKCPYMTNTHTSVLSYVENINTNNNQIISMESELSKINEEYTILYNLNNLNEIVKKINIFISNYIINNFMVSISLSCDDNLIDLVKNNKYQIFDIEKIEDCISKLSLYNRMTDLQLKLERLKSIDFNNDMYYDLNERKERLKKDKEKNNKLIDDNTNLINSYNIEIDKYNVQIDNISRYLEDKKKISELDKLREERDLYIKFIEKHDDLASKINKLNDDINAKKQLIDTATEVRDDTVSRINEYKKVIKQKEVLEEYYTDIEITKKALSPNKGIPLRFINSYLQKTRHIANELLKQAFNGELLLDEFVINEKEFKIPVIGKGDGVDDAGKCSSGERALITLAISLALFRQNKTKYNILGLDELDGPLDEENRRKFLHLIELQTDIAQIFNITHNNMFNDVRANIILFKGAKIDSFVDKKILFKF